MRQLSMALMDRRGRRGVGGQVLLLVLAAAGLLPFGVGCDSAASNSGPPAPSRHQNDLKTMDTARITIDDHPFEVWIARTVEERNLGLMQVTAEVMADLADGTPRGMLFVFKQEHVLQFWMKNTLIPLDIAFIRNDGEIVRITTMAPQDTRLYSSGMPANLALEVRAGLFHELGIREGDVVQIPDSALKPSKG
jgi:uncharacterized membrane protein (UPF0127 family)